MIFKAGKTLFYLLISKTAGHVPPQVDWAPDALDDPDLYNRRFFILAHQKDAPALMAFSPAFRYLPPGSSRRARRQTMPWGQ
jgi:hypothetical protein